MTKTGIPYLDVTWSPARGCPKPTLGPELTQHGHPCAHRWAERMAKRFCQPQYTHIFAPASGKVTPAGPFHLFADERGWTGRVELLGDKLDEPLRSRKPQRVGVCFTSDWMHPALPDSARDRMLGVMALCQQHTFVCLTKRWREQYEYLSEPDISRRLAMAALNRWIGAGFSPPPHWPLPNVWLGVTARDQPSLDEAADWLLKTPAEVRWVSLEPLLGPVILQGRGEYGKPDAPVSREYLRGVLGDERLNLVVAGCESGPRRRPAQLGWFRSLAEQCDIAGVPFWLKQMEIDGKVTENPPLDGVQWMQLPEGQ